MPSSISSSELRVKPRDYTRPVVWALATLILLLFLLEAVTRMGFQRISRIESRTYAEYKAALAIRRGLSSKPSVLLVGNSLLLEGVDYDRLRAELQNDVVPTRFVIEQTYFDDWYFGIRRLLAEGSRPDRIVLCLNVQQTAIDALRGEYSAYYLIQARDLMEAGTVAGYSPTEISGLYFAHYSLFLAGANNLRNFTLNKADLPYADVLRDVTRGKQPPVADSEVYSMTVKHLQHLQSVCAQYHTRCEILLPPGFVPPSDAGLIEAGKSTGTRIIIPVPLGAWGQDSYRDGFHLNPAGAEKFTDLLAIALRER